MYFDVFLYSYSLSNTLTLRQLVGKALRKLKGPQYEPPQTDNHERYLIQGSWMYVDDKDSLNLTKYGIYEPVETTMIKKLIKPNYVVLDIGANIGYFTLMMAKQSKQLYAFEPEPRNYQTLQKNIEFNHLENVHLYNYAIAEVSGITTLHLCDTNRGMHRIYESQFCKEGTVNVETIAIDDLIEYADFIKIDIEGAELGALKGMKRLLKKHHPILLMEFHPPSIIEYGVQPRDVFDFVVEMGYLVEIPNVGPVTFEQLEKLSIEKAGTNILCKIDR